MFSRFFNAVRSWIASHKWSSGIALLLIAGGGLWYYSNATTGPELQIATVTLGVVAQIVSVTGAVEPASEVSLAFDKAGRIASVYANVGDRVAAGAVLAALSGRDLSAQIDQAKATLRAEEAQLEELKRGTRPEDIAVSETAVGNAESALLNSIKSAYVSADDAIRNKIDQFFANPRTSNPQLTFIMADGQLKYDIENARTEIERVLQSWNASLSGGIPASAAHAAIDAKTNLRAIQTFLDKVALAVNSLTTASTLSQTTTDSYKSATLTARTNVASALSSVTTADDARRTAQSELALKKAGSTKEVIEAQEAQVEAARAGVANLEAQLSKMVIVTPIAGVVTKQDAKAGEAATVGVPLISVISSSAYKIEANIPESDIAKVRPGDPARVTLDAYGRDDVFEATVVKIDPAETVIDGVPTYKTTLQFTQNDLRIRPGMTANTDIAGQKRENVLFIPARAVSEKNGVKTVNVLEGETQAERQVVTGLRGSDGTIEVVSGLSEGEKIVLD